MSKMRVLFIATSLEVGGIQDQIAMIANGLTDRGFEVRVLGLYGNDQLVGLNSAIVQDCLGLAVGSKTALVQAVRSVRRRLSSWRPDVVHTHAVHSNVVGRLAALGTGIPVVSTVHNQREGGRLPGFASRITFRLSALTSAVSVPVKEAAEANGSAPRGQLRVVVNGVDTKALLRDQPDVDEVRTEIGIPEGQKIVMCVGRLSPAKGHDLLLRSFAEVATVRDDTHLVLVGDGPLRTEIEQQVPTGPIGNRVHFLGRRTDVPRLLRAADLVAMPSYWEGMPIVCLEVMAVGRPFITSDIAPITAITQGLVPHVPVGDHKALTEGILRLLGTPTPPDQLERARNRAAEFGSDAAIERWVSIYREVVHPHEAGPAGSASGVNADSEEDER